MSGDLTHEGRRPGALEHEHGWHHHRDPDTGDSLWTTPTGRTTYGRAAHRLPVGTPISPPAGRPAADVGPPPF